MIGVVVVDDQALIRAGIVTLLASDPNIDVRGQAANGIEALRTVIDTSPDVVLMDIRMPELDGIEATRSIKNLNQPPAVLILTTFDTDDHVYEALKAGADGFLVKDTPPARLLDAVHAVNEGGVVISPQTTSRLREQMIAAAEPSRMPGTEDLAILTTREVEVLACVGRGLNNREIGEELYIAEATAKTHVSRIMTKLNLNTRVHAVILAYDAGLVIPG